MKKRLILSIVLSGVLLSTACTFSDNGLKSETKETNISIEDQAIIKKYKDRINGLNFNDKELVNKTMKDSLSEISKIKDKDEREKIEMNIYLATGMYEEAYELNTKILEQYPFIANLLTQCELIHTLKFSKKEFEKCQLELALAFKKELDSIPKNDPEYIYGEWGYFLSMYKAGHKEYQVKLKKILDSIKDEQLKFQLESSYELAIEQTK